MATVGVLCARGRVEEKALMAALAEAGIVSALFPPTDEPLPVGPLFPMASGRSFPVPQIVVDRHPDRQIARAVLATCRALDVPGLCAGIAAAGDRLDVASALAAKGLPRPETALCTSENAGLAAVAAMGLPATVLPLDLKSQPIDLPDIDTAEAVLEHRSVLGGSEGSLGLVQAGTPPPENVVTIFVIDGVATALETSMAMGVSVEVLRLAEQTARALFADVIAVVIALTPSGPIVWDVRPVPEFRHAQALTELSVPQAIAQAVQHRLEPVSAPRLPSDSTPDWTNLVTQGTRRDLVISA
ncbi:MAG: hypothetical protein H0V00_13335 [Chloroflexia bacterium]|nr:hypothetical protein [Chloroflexia bacterium]